jgi:hypothetical protein
VIILLGVVAIEKIPEYRIFCIPGVL